MDELTSEFLPVIEDPTQVAQLYQLLREHCHDLRGTLGEYRMTAYMARRNGVTTPAQEVLDRFETRYGVLLQFLDDLQMICRPVVPNRSNVALGTVLDEAHRRWATMLGHRGRPLQWIEPTNPREGNLDTLLLGHALDAFVAWRAEAGTGGHGVRACWSTGGRRIRLVWDEPGVEVRSTHSALPCLAPVLLGRILQAHGGTMTLDDREGFRLDLSLPTVEVEVERDPARRAGAVPGARVRWSAGDPPPTFAMG